MKKDEVKEAAPKKVDKGMAVWEAIKDLPMSIFSLPAQKVSSYFTLVATLDESAILRLSTSATAALAALEQVLNVKTTPLGDQKQVERFVVTIAENGLITVKFKTALS